MREFEIIHLLGHLSIGSQRPLGVFRAYPFAQSHPLRHLLPLLFGLQVLYKFAQVIGHEGKQEYQTSFRLHLSMNIGLCSSSDSPESCTVNTVTIKDKDTQPAFVETPLNTIHNIIYQDF